MRKKIFTCSQLSITIVATASVLYSQVVLKTDMRSPDQVVQARKYIMKIITENMGDMANKLKAGNIQDIPVNAGSIAAMTIVLPPLYREKYEQAYPIKGSDYYFKGAPASEFELASQKLRSAAITIKKDSENGNKADIQAGLAILVSACRSCHSAYRGQY